MYDGTMKNVRQQDTATEIQITHAQSEDILSARINQKTDFVYNAKTGELKIGEETFVTDAGIRDFSLLFDDVILEMTADCGTITDIFELPEIAEKFCNEKEWEYMEMCTSNRVAGVILCSGTVGVEKFTGLNVPLITIERYLENGTAEVECDNEQGGRLAAQHLIDCGCKHLIHISGVHETAMPADARAVGFRAVCEKQKVSYQIADTTAFEYNHLEYHQILEKLLKENPDTDGIFASSDLIAAQLLQVCHNLNIDVPSQMKIVGFDDVNIASLTTPPITTIHQPIKEMAKMAVELLVRSGNGELVPNRTTLPVSLVVRETT